MAGDKLPFEKETSQLYRGILHSLGDEAATYLIDDYLSSIAGAERIPTKYDSDTTCFVVRGRGSTRSLTFLLSSSGALHPMGCPEHMDGAFGNNSYLNIVASNLLSACLAMKKIQSNKKRALPIDVYFVLVGNEERKPGYQRFNAQFLRESILDTIGSGTHLIVVESTGLRVCSVQKGCLVFRLAIRGRSNHPAFSWLGEDPWDVLIRFEESLASMMKPKHELYPVEVGKAPSMMLSNFLIGYPTMTTLQVEYHQPYLFGERSSLEAEYYVCIPPEFPYKNFKERLSSTVKEIAKDIGCEALVAVIYEEEPFREDAQSVIVKATSSAFQKLTGFEPIFEWLPYPISAKDLTSSGFARDVVALGLGDWTFTGAQDEKTVVAEAVRLSEILAEIPYEVTLLQEKR